MIVFDGMMNGTSEGLETGQWRCGWEGVVSVADADGVECLLLRVVVVVVVVDFPSKRDSRPLDVVVIVVA
jgi:hypothetical protein